MIDFKSVADAWKEYEHHLITLNTSLADIEKFRNFFYSGATAVFASTMNIMAKGDIHVSEDTLEAIDSIRLELNAHVEGIGILLN